MNVMTNHCSCFIGIISTSNSGKSLTADESSLGILQLDGLPGKMSFAWEQNDRLKKNWLVVGPKCSKILPSTNFIMGKMSFAWWQK